MGIYLYSVMDILQSAILTGQIYLGSRRDGAGKGNQADYWTKHFCAALTIGGKRPLMLTPVGVLQKLRRTKG